MAQDIPRVRMLRGDEAELFRAHGAKLRRAVNAAVVAPDACVDDACSFAWLQLMRHQPERDTVFSWLYTVAIREAWRLARRERRDDHLEAAGPSREPADDALERTTRAHEALAALADLPERQRRYLALIVSGHTYDEIARHFGTTYTNVNKHLVRARRAIRDHRTDA